MDNDFFNKIREKQNQSFFNYLNKMIKENRKFSWTLNDGINSAKLTVDPKNMINDENPMRSITAMAEICAIELTNK